MPNKERAIAMRAIVDQERCTGRGTREGICTKVFEFVDNAAKVELGETVAR